jgi:mannose-6-phosphate isomerase-like protein (cupin superfamily)
MATLYPGYLSEPRSRSEGLRRPVTAAADHGRGVCLPARDFARQVQCGNIVKFGSCDRGTAVEFDKWRTKDLPADADYLAPDGSEIRLLLSFARGGLAHCTLPPGQVSSAVKHRTVEEIWYFTEGRGEVSRREGNDHHVVPVHPGRCIDIEQGVEFQFRNTGDQPLRFLIVTMPRWPGPEEAQPGAGPWPTT